jgi:hypothetical protein
MILTRKLVKTAVVLGAARCVAKRMARPHGLGAVGKGLALVGVATLAKKAMERRRAHKDAPAAVVA